MSAGCRGQWPPAPASAISAASAPGDRIRDELETEEMLSGFIIINENITPDEAVQPNSEPFFLGDGLGAANARCADPQRRHAGNRRYVRADHRQLHQCLRLVSDASGALDDDPVRRPESAFRAQSTATSPKRSSRSSRNMICSRSGKTQRPLTSTIPVRPLNIRHITKYTSSEMSTSRTRC